MLMELIKNFASSDFPLKGENLLIAFKQLYQAAGWGIIEYVNIDKKQRTGKIHVYHSIAENVTQKYNEPICYYTKGHLTALLQEIFNFQTVYIDEVKCIAMGDKYCEFKFEC
jgi:predicted hydrocarbon binding protein